MTQQEINKFLTQLETAYFLYGPNLHDWGIKIEEIKQLADLDWSGQIPENTWKSVFLPSSEKILDLGKRGYKEIVGKYPPIACLNVNVLDLKALTLLEQVFSQDANYQARRRNLLLIGYSCHWPDDYKRYKVFSHKWEEDYLEHVVFDIFLVKLKNNTFKVYSGSEKGQVLLEKFGLSKYQHVEFAGAIAEQGPDKRMLQIKKKIDQSFDRKIWNELNKICLACGKCAVNCPTCFCFNLVDQWQPDNLGRHRQTTTCFYNDFSKVAGGHKPLESVKAKIYFWYVHKFVRIPHEYSLPGCVSCGRCAKTCPVGIKIKDTLKAL